MNRNIQHFKHQLGILKKQKVLSKESTAKQIARYIKAIEDGILDYPEYPETCDQNLKDRAIACGISRWTIAKAAKEAAEDFCNGGGYPELFQTYIKLYGRK